MRKYITTVIICLGFSLLIGNPPNIMAQDGDILRSQLERIQRATVFIYQVDDTGEDFFITCVGSGTIISRNGLILANAHNTTNNAVCNGDTLIISISIRLDEPPIPIYRAEVTQADEGLDIALLRINQDIDGRRINTQELSLPFVELGDSSQVALDETIVITGYESLGDDPIRVERSTVAGFFSEPIGRNRSWIKTSVSLPGLMSGGGAYNQQGQLIGIPTTTPPALTTDTSTCRVLQDTNQDNLINNNDNCVPVGGFINALRPSNFASPLFRAASLGLQVNLDLTSLSPITLNEEPEIQRMFFSTSVNESNMPTNIVSSLPTGANSLFLFFDYTNMSPENVYELRVTTNNIPNPSFSLAPVRWSGGNSGMWYIGSGEQAWPNGIYDFTIFVDGIAKNTANIVIGGAPINNPAFSDIVFGLSDIDGTPLGNGYVLPTGSIASARFIYRNMANGTEWIARWFYEGSEIFRTPPDVWRDGENGSKTISIRDSNGLLPGRYRLELYIDGRLAATSNFTMAGEAEGAFPRVFNNTHFASAANAQEAITAPENSNFTTNIENLFALFDWSRIARGTLWTVRWSVDDDIFYERRIRWSNAEQGENFVISLARASGLPDGTYRFDLFIDEVQLASAEAIIGIGQLPIDRFASAQGIQLNGTIYDIDTQEGIEGVTFVVISEEFSVADFVWDSRQVYDLAKTDRLGNFQLGRLLEISTDEITVPYSVVVYAEGYLPIQADGFIVDSETENPLEITIYMTKE